MPNKALVLFFRCGELPAAGLIVTDGIDPDTYTTDEHGRIVNPPRSFLIDGAKLHITLPDGRQVDRIVELAAADGLPQPIQVPAWQAADAKAGSLRGALVHWTRVVWDHWVAIVILTVALGAGAAVAKIAG